MSKEILERWRLSRRNLLRGLGVSAAATLAIPMTVRESLAQPIFTDFPFQLGVTSGDPAADGFVLWTRLAPKPFEEDWGMPKARVEVGWEVARDRGFRDIARSGTAVAHPELGHAVHVEVTGLEPGRPYFYRFQAGRERSFVGRAKTLPAPGTPVDKVRFAVVGCQNYQQGLYTAYRYAAQEELDFFYCYGDYIYEGRGGRVGGFGGQISETLRPHHGDEIYTLGDYRRRYAQYKMDVDLMTAHASAPWFAVWDDHEIDNNWADMTDQDDTPKEVFRLRRIAAMQAYYENMPFRPTAFPDGSRMQIYRRARVGDLLTLNLLDTRQHRSNQACEAEGAGPLCDEIADPKRSILGEAQEQWLYAGLSDSKTRWNGIAQQVMVMDFDRDANDTVFGVNRDAWAGYRAGRQRLLDHLHDNRIANAVVLTGDVHQNFAGDIQWKGAQSDTAAVATEFVSTSISSGGDGADLREGGDKVLANNPHVKLMNGQRGYLVCDVSPERWQTEFKVLDKVTTPDGTLSTRATFAVDPMKPGVQTA